MLLSLVAGLATADTDAAKVFHGAIYVESYNQVMVIAIDTEGASQRDGNADNVFVVATPDSFDTPISYRWTNANLVFKPSGLMVTSPSDREALIVTFERDIPRATFAAPADFRTTRVSNAIGLAHHSSLASVYPMELMPRGHMKSSRAGSNTYENDWFRQPFNQDWNSSGGSGGGSGCTSGGSGSTSCSISGCASTSYKNDCSVTCFSGYYACCNCGSCICLRYDGRP
ncbi:MAG TPA: hypothetical protein VJ901_17190 [Thermoanaerobaculia bacterium]|nr:hypothetical protein [Thermoanaerobaculia bacterium]